MQPLLYNIKQITLETNNPSLVVVIFNQTVTTKYEVDSGFLAETKRILPEDRLLFQIERAVIDQNSSVENDRWYHSVDHKDSVGVLFNYTRTYAKVEYASDKLNQFWNIGTISQLIEAIHKKLQEYSPNTVLMQTKGVHTLGGHINEAIRHFYSSILIVQPEVPFVTDKQEILEKFQELQSTFDESLLIYHEDDGSVSYDGMVDFSHRNLTHLPFKFRKIDGYFDISNNNLTTLHGCPEEVSGNFYCKRNNLITLDGGPKVVGGVYWCYDNPLQNFTGFPESYEDIWFTPDHLITQNFLG